VSTVREAVAQLNGHVPDLMIVDIGLPDKDGYELIRQVRSLDSVSGIPAVALTAYAQLGDRDRALAAGFQLHIAKPVHPAEFLHTVGELAHRYRDWHG
jgi:CheY-like chemotaxis protein